MPSFTYKAKNEYGRTIKGTLIASNEDQLAASLDQIGLYLISAKKTTIAASYLSWESIKRKDLITFTVHLSTTLSAGIPILQSLQDLIEQSEKPRFKNIIEDVSRNIQAGSSLSEALSKHPKVFSELYVSMVKAGETTGNVDKVLNDLVAFLEWQELLAMDVKQATIYPAFVLSAVISLVVLLMTFVFPRFTVIFERTNAPLPLPTRVVMGISHFTTSYWFIIVLVVMALIVSHRLAVKTPGGRYLFDKLKLKLPVFGNLLRKIALSRFSHHFGALLKAGVEIYHSLMVTEKVVGNTVIAKVISSARDYISAGESLSESLKKGNEFPSLVIRMIAIGESSGNLDKTLGKVSQYYDREVPITIKKVFAVFEPIVIASLAVVVLGMALSMFLPLYQMLNLVGK